MRGEVLLEGGGRKSGLARGSSMGGFAKGNAHAPIWYKFHVLVRRRT